MRARRHRHRRATAIVLGTGGLILMASCATFGGNVRGSFFCSAPDGTCAPSAAIDDRALAAISSGEEGGDFVPASGETRSGGNTRAPLARASLARPAPLDPARTHERVLRIVFQPYIDERGRLHEATAVHAVVQTGDWQQAFAQRNVPIGTGLVSFADAVDRADPPRGGAPADVLPSPEAVAAARARKANLGTTTKTDASDRLAPGAMRAPVSAVPPTPPAPRGGSAGRGLDDRDVRTGSAATQTTADAAADARSGTDLRTVMDALGRGAGAARALPDDKSGATAPVIRAPGFPAQVAKDD